MTATSMRQLLYCITTRQTAATIAADDASLEGCRGQPIRWRETESLAVAASRLETPDLPTSPRPEDVEHYERVVERVFDVGSVVPLQFGHTLGADSDAIDLVDSHRASFESMLERFEGRAEASLRMFVSDEMLPDAPDSKAPDPEAFDSGASYLDARRRQLRDEAERSDPMAIEVVEDVHGRLADLAVETTIELDRDSAWFDGPTVGLYLLVERSDLSALWERIDRLSARVEPRIEATGPWPPYNFTSTESHRGASRNHWTSTSA
jgi:hypothetical protein